MTKEIQKHVITSIEEDATKANIYMCRTNQLNGS